MQKKVISINVSLNSNSEIVNQISLLAQKKESSYVCVANVHMCIEAKQDVSFANVVNDANIVTADGMPLVISLKLIYGIKQERVAGMDLLPDLLKESEKKSLNLFFYGGTEEMLLTTKKFINQQYPQIKKHYYYSPPFRKLSIEEENDVINKINESEANIVFVVLGCPKQEKWMASMKGKINACMIGIGGALPVMIGTQKRAPLWMRKASLEWLYRFLQEPRRLFKRYLITNSLFIFLIVKEIYKKKKR